MLHWDKAGVHDVLWVIWKNQGASSKPCVRSTMNFYSVEPLDDPLYVVEYLC